jgi:hypothetical protein
VRSAIEAPSAVQRLSKRRGWFAAAGIAAVLALAGCSGTSPEDAYVAAVEADAPGVSDLGSREDLIEAGRNACESFERGEAADAQIERLVELQIPEEEATAIVTQAEAHLCAAE